MEISDALPGADLIRAGLRDIAQGVDSIEALLVLVGAPRLRRLGFDVPDTPDYPEPMTALGYRFGINYIVYAMTH